METRLNLEKIEPSAYEAMLSLEGYVRKSSLKQAYKHLIKIRTSQINGCAYCIEMHTADARRHGETESRIYALTAWKESPLFSAEERALLQLTEDATLIAGNGVTDETYASLEKYFDDAGIAQAIMQVVVTNAWNRIAISTRKMHPHQVQSVANER